MKTHRNPLAQISLSAITLATLVGCAVTPLGPTVQVMPGRGKAFETFQSDQAGCKSFAAGQVSGQADAANQRITDALGVQNTRSESEPSDEGNEGSEQAS